jgi:hypothetical protein
MKPISNSSPVLNLAAFVAVIFGLLTIFSGGMALFGGAEMGNTVGFVLWFNFLAGFFYVVAGIGLALKRVWSWWLALAIAIGSATVLAAFGLYVVRGGAYEMRTVFAMTLRTAVWLVMPLVAWCTIGPRSSHPPTERHST